MSRLVSNMHLYLLVVLVCLTACNQLGSFPDEGNSPDLQEILSDNVFLTEEGYKLELTEQEAIEKYGITADTYQHLSAGVENTNAQFLHYLDTLSTEDKIIVLFPKKKILAYPDDRLTTGEDQLLSRSQLRDHGRIDYACKAGFTVSTTINGGPATGSASMPSQTRIIRYSAGTNCLFGVFHGTIQASGQRVSYTGSGFSPCAGSFSPGTDEGICIATIGSTGCTARLMVCFWAIEGN